MTDGPEALLLTGVYGSGKTSVAAELADLLEKRGAAYAAIDLDWLTWFDTGGPFDHDDLTMTLANLGPMLDNYRAAGIGRFVLAGSMRSARELRSWLAERGITLRVVRLSVPLPEIARRLQADVTTARADDLREAEAWLAAGVGEGIEDTAVANDRPIREVAEHILGWLQWA